MCVLNLKVNTQPNFRRETGDICERGVAVCFIGSAIPLSSDGSHVQGNHGLAFEHERARAV